MRSSPLVGAVALIVAACSGGATATTKPAAGTAATPSTAATTSATAGATASGSPAAGGTGLHIVLAGKDMCAYLTVDDFTAAGVSGAATATENNTDKEFYCVYKGLSGATGGIELDAFVYEDSADLDAGYDSEKPTDNVVDVTAQVPNAEVAAVGTTVSGGPEFAIIAVRSGNLVYGISIPATGDYQTQLVALANAFMTRVQTLTSAAP